MPEELRTLEYGQRLHHRSRNVLAPPGGSTGGALFAAAMHGGSQATGVAAGIAAGNAADLVSLDTAHPSLAARDAGDVIDGLVFAAGRDAIDRVWRRGREVVRAGRHHDRDRIVAEYVRVLSRLLRRAD